jgi:putative ATP-dependent endonuclease of OLD family
LYIAKIYIKNFRCFRDTTVEFQPGLNVIIGENNGGKTTLLKARALVFDRRGAKRPRVHDFNRLIKPSYKPPEIVIAVTLRSSGAADTAGDRGLVASWLTRIDSPWEATLTFTFSLPETEHPEFEEAVGNNPNEQTFFDAIEELLPKYVSRIYSGNLATRLSVDRELLAKFDCQFLDALRDVESEMFSGGSPLFNAMLKEVLDTRVDDEVIRKTRNKFREDSKELRDGLKSRLDTDRLFDLVTETGAADGGRPALDGGIRESDILATLKLYIQNENFSFPATHQGLGYNNLIYISLMMASMSFSASKRRGENAAVFPMLMVEEPEAHLHPALQHKLLSHIIKRVSDSANGSRQVFVTTHSTHVTSAVGLDPIICLSVAKDGNIDVAYPARLFPNTKEGRASKGYVARYLDATKSTMLFAKGIVLVEGIAEQLIVPAIASRIGFPFDQSHVAIVRVDGLTFKHFLPLFGIGCDPTENDYCLKKAVSCIVDGDPARKLRKTKGATWTACYPFQLHVDPDIYDYIPVSLTASNLIDATSGDVNVKVFLATKTLEYDLAYANASREQFVSESMVQHVELLKFVRTPETIPPKIKEKFAGDELIALESQSEELVKHRHTYAAAYLKCAKDCKGEHAFAIESVIRDNTVEFNCPAYIENAIKWATRIEAAKS